MSKTTSNNSGSDWPVTKFIIAITGLITAFAGLWVVAGNLPGPTPTPTPRVEARPAGDVERPPDPQPTNTPRPTSTSLPSRTSILREVNRLQAEAIAALASGNLLEANNLLEQSESLIDEALDRWPEDLEFMNLRAYHYKNMAMSLLRLEMDSEMEDYLVEAERWFRLVHSVDPENAAAWNGLGSVYLLRCEIDEGEAFIKKALELNPNYAAAERDLEKVPQFRNWCDRRAAEES
jgi:hypothetical protein